MATLKMLSTVSCGLHFSLRIVYNHQKSVAIGTQSLHNRADFDPDPVQEKAIESTTCKIRLHRRFGRYSYLIEFIR